MSYVFLTNSTICKEVKLSCNKVLEVLKLDVTRTCQNTNTDQERIFCQGNCIRVCIENLKSKCCCKGLEMAFGLLHGGYF